MTVLTYPSAIRASRFNFRLVTNSGVFESPLSNSVQTIERSGAYWAADIAYDRLPESEHRTLKAFIASLAGRAGRFYLFDFGDPEPLGDAGGTPLVAGAAQTGNSLDVDGFDNSVTDIMKAGDYFSVVTPSGRELKVMTADADSNGSGEATLNFKPPLRESPADNAPLTTSNATCIMMLSDDDSFSWEAHPGRTYSWRISCREAFTT